MPPAQRGVSVQVSAQSGDYDGWPGSYCNAPLGLFASIMDVSPLRGTLTEMIPGELRIEGSKCLGDGAIDSTMACVYSVLRSTLRRMAIVPSP